MYNKYTCIYNILYIIFENQIYSIIYSSICGYLVFPVLLIEDIVFGPMHVFGIFTEN
jgi:hypothetical protein